MVAGFLVTVLAVLAVSAPASGFDELTGCTMEFAPVEMDQARSTHFTVTIHNNNNRSLTVTSMTMQITNGFMHGMSDDFRLYQVSTIDGIIPAGGSKQFGHDGIAPDFIGQCSVIVTISGILEGSDNTSIGLFTASTMLNPTMPVGLISLGILLLVIAVVVIIAVVILIVVLMGKNKQPAGRPPMGCPSCGAPNSSGGLFCPQCGRKN